MSRFSKPTRAAVEERAGERCEYCHLPMRGQAATFPIDHVVPRTSGGSGHPDNLALACPKCNARKWAHIDGNSGVGKVVRLFNPRLDNWHDHFQWSASQWGVLEGSTPIGRATIDRLQMNDPELVITRRLLAALGVAPDAAG